jgi:hypothetical protein
MLKSNVDGSFIGKPELVDIKGVLRNHKGLGFDFSSTHIGIKDSNEAWLLALIKVLKLSS